MTAKVGTLLSTRYRLDAKVGAGGMSTVYRAFDTVLERQVAIKVMHREIAAEPEQLERFRREARAVAQLNHPNVVGVIDADEDGVTPYIVFEYVEGETLKDRIRRLGRLPVPEAVAYAVEIARALGVAHAHGIVHRDVKPQNVLLDEEGMAKVTDFGIARTLDQQGLTADGRVLGTTDYVSPEQALGRSVTGQSDLYSLGIVLYEMLTGDVPFKGENQVAVAMKHVREELPDVQLARPDCSSALASVVDRATAKDLAVRYPDADALIADLERSLTDEAARAGQASGQVTAVLDTLPRASRDRVPRRVRHPGRWIATVALVALLAAGVGYLLYDRAERGTGTSRAQTAPPSIDPVSLGQRAASDYDPLGDDSEHSDEADRVLDGDPSSSWSTETYQGNDLQKDGVGLYVDARPRARAVRMDLRSLTPGWSGAIYGADAPRPQQLSGWTKLADVRDAKATQSVTLPGRSYRYFLVWITALPSDSDQVQLAELNLFQRGS